MYKVLGPARSEFSPLGSKYTVLLRHSLTINNLFQRQGKEMS